MADTQLNLLFVCVENACRSQMAEGLAKLHGGSRVHAWSAGSHPRGSVDPRTIEVMKERGIALNSQASKGIASLPPLPWDVVVGMGCGDEACAVVPAKQHLSWNIPAPSGADLAPYRAACDLIEQHVKRLLSSLGISS